MEPGYSGGGQVYVRISDFNEDCGLWLSPSEARQVAATITAIADGAPIPTF